MTLFFTKKINKYTIKISSIIYVLPFHVNHPTGYKELDNITMYLFYYKNIFTISFLHSALFRGFSMISVKMNTNRDEVSSCKAEYYYHYY